MTGSMLNTDSIKSLCLQWKSQVFFFFGAIEAHFQSRIAHLTNLLWDFVNDLNNYDNDFTDEL